MTAFKNFNEWLSSSIMVKLVSIGFLTLILLIPGAMIQSLITERQLLSLDTEKDISSHWGGNQVLTGPILMIPFKKEQLIDGKTTLVKAMAYVLPENLRITGVVKSDTRYRGIYKSVIYNARLSLSGNFKSRDWLALGFDKSMVIADEVSLVIGIPDMRGIKNSSILDWNGKKIPSEPGLKNKDIAQSGLTIKIDWPQLLEKDSAEFALDLDLNGSGTLDFIPVGKNTKVDISSPWKDPSFTGSFLPEPRKIDETGFEAHWNVLHFNRNFPQQWQGNAFDMTSSSFGVKFIIPIDQYQKTMRSAKYAIMFLALTFAIFFFVEVINHKRIHPIQYLFVGLALTFFYTLLLSLSEQMSFNLAFVISAVAIITLVTLYSKAIFKKLKLVLVMAGFLTALYGFLYILLQLEDYALLLGSVGLFSVLGIIMYLSRNINWFQPIAQKETPQEIPDTKNV